MPGHYHLESLPEKSTRTPGQSFRAIATACRAASTSDAGPEAATTKERAGAAASRG